MNLTVNSDDSFSASNSAGSSLTVQGFLIKTDSEEFACHRQPSNKTELKRTNRIRKYEPMHPTLVFLKVLKPYYSKRLMRFGSRGPKRHRKALRPRRPWQTVLQGQYYNRPLSIYQNSS